MPDLGVPYTLTTPAGTIVFNDDTVGVIDKHWIADIQGLSGAPVRAPIDDMPFGHGGLGHDFWEGGRHITVDGHFLVQSVGPCDDRVEIWNLMEENLRVALRSIASLVIDTGTLAWTPRGLSANLLTVRHDVQLECPPDQNYLLRAFHFGLFAEIPDWDGWSS